MRRGNVKRFELEGEEHNVSEQGRRKKQFQRALSKES